MATFSHDFLGPYPGRYATDNSGGSTQTTGTWGAVLATAATGVSYRSISDPGLTDNFNIYDHNPYFTFTGLSYIGGTTTQSQVGMGAVYNYFNTTIDANGKGFGFRFYISGGVTFTEGYAKNTATGIQTVDLAYTGNAGATDVYTARLTSNSKVEFFINDIKKGEITTGLPTGNPYMSMWRTAVTQTAGTLASQLNLNMLKYGYTVS